MNLSHFIKKLFADGNKSYDFISQPNHNDNRNKASIVRNTVKGLLESLMKNDDTQPLDERGLDYLGNNFQDFNKY